MMSSISKQSVEAIHIHLRLFFSIEEDTEIDPIETEVDMELGIGDGDDVRDHVEIDPRDVRDDTEEYEADTSARDTVEVGIDPMSAPIVEEEIVEPAGEDSSDSSGTRDGIVRSFEDMPIDLDDAVRDFYHHMSEVRIDRIVGIKTVQRRLEADQLIARGQRVSMIERIDSLRLENLKGGVSLGFRSDRWILRGRLRSALTWWNFHKRTIRTDVAYTLSWRELLKLMTEKPQDYKVLVRIANNLMDQKLKGYAVRNAENKRRLNNNYRNNRGQQLPYKRQNTRGQNVARAYMAGNNEKNGYEGTLPFGIGVANHERTMTLPEGFVPKSRTKTVGTKQEFLCREGRNICLGGRLVTLTGFQHCHGALLDIIPSALNVSYAFELADGRTLETNTVLRGYTLRLLGHPRA
ncbi:hypothetical protein Tco_0794014 [Tanacetum coccineum]